MKQDTLIGKKVRKIIQNNEQIDVQVEEISYILTDMVWAIDPVIFGDISAMGALTKQKREAPIENLKEVYCAAKTKSYDEWVDMLSEEKYQIKKEEL